MFKAANPTSKNSFPESSRSHPPAQISTSGKQLTNRCNNLHVMNEKIRWKQHFWQCIQPTCTWTTLEAKHCPHASFKTWKFFILFIERISNSVIYTTTLTTGIKAMQLHVWTTYRTTSLSLSCSSFRAMGGGGSAHTLRFSALMSVALTIKTTLTHFWTRFLCPYL